MSRSCLACLFRVAKWINANGHMHGLGLRGAYANLNLKKNPVDKKLHLIVNFHNMIHTRLFLKICCVRPKSQISLIRVKI